MTEILDPQSNIEFLIHSLHDFHGDNNEREAIVSAIEALNNACQFVVGQLPANYTFPQKKYQLIEQSNNTEMRLLEIIAHINNICFNLSNMWAKRMIIAILERRTTMARFESVVLMDTPYRFHKLMRHSLKARQITLIVTEKIKTELTYWYRKFSEVEHFILILGSVASERVALDLPRTVHTFEVYPAGDIDTLPLNGVLQQAKYDQIAAIGLNGSMLSNFDDMVDNFAILQEVILREPYHHEYGTPLIRKILYEWKLRAAIIIVNEPADGEACDARNKINAVIDENLRVEEKTTEIGKITFIVTKVN